MIVSFGSFVLDTLARTLEGSDGPVALQPKTFDVLAFLVRERHRVISRAELTETLWPDETVSPTALNVAINSVRRALGDSGEAQAWIETHRGRGYRFAGPVETREGELRERSFDPTKVFVGRQAELSELDQAFSQVVGEGAGRLVLLRGEAGIGKTRLAKEVSERCVARGARLATANCLMGSGAPPFLLFAQLAEQIVSDLDEEEQSQVVESLANELGLLVHPLVESQDPGQEFLDADPHARLRLFGAMSEFLHRVAGRRGLVIVIDDLQWADESSLLLLQSVVSRIARSALLIVATIRTRELEQGDPREAVHLGLERNERSRRVDLRGLSETDVASLLTAVGSPQATSGFARTLHDGTEGNPFFILETLRHLAEDDAARNAQPRDRATGFRIADLAKVDGVRSIVSHRLTRLDRGAKEILGIASVIGREFDFVDLRAIADNEGSIAHHLSNAVASQIVFEHPEIDGRYLFGHAVIREVLYHELGAPGRAELHGRIAEGLAEARALVPSRAHPAHSYSRIAEHAELSLSVAPTLDQVRTAVNYRQKAASEASSGLAFEDAVNHLGAALEMLRKHGLADADLECELLLESMDAHSLAGHAAEANRLAHEAANIARRSDSPQHLIRAALGGQAEMVQPIGGAESQAPLLLEALDRMGEEISATRALLLARLALVYSYSESATDERDDLTRRAETIARACESDRALYWSLVARHAAMAGLKDANETLAVIDELTAIAERLDDDALIMRAAAYRVGALLRVGRATEAFDWIDRVDVLEKKVCSPLYEWTIKNFRACEAQVRGAPDAEALALDTLHSGQKTDHESASLVYVCQIGALRYGADRLSELEPALANLPNEAGLSIVPAVGALAACQRGAVDEAVSRVESFLGTNCSGVRRDNLRAGALALIAPVLRASEDRARAQALYSDLIAHEAGFIVVGNATACLGSTARALGILAETLGERATARRHFQNAIAIEEREELRVWAIHSRLELARFLLAGDAASDRMLAVEELSRARRSAENLALNRLVESIDDLAATA